MIANARATIGVLAMTADTGNSASTIPLLYAWEGFGYRDTR